MTYMKNQKDQNQNSFEITKEEQAKWSNSSVLRDMHGQSPVIDPSLLMVTAQPGAGKSRLVRKLVGTFNGASYSHVDIDAIRTDHPHIKRIMIDNPFQLSPITNAPAHEIRMHLLEVAKGIPTHILYEATLNEPDWIVNLVKDYQDDGYAFEMHALAIPSKWSVLGIFQRFEQEAAKPDGIPRMVDLGYHDTVYNSFDTNIKTIIDECIPNIGRLYDGQLNTIWDYKGSTSRLIPAIERERTRDKTPDEINEYEARWNTTISLMDKRKRLPKEPKEYRIDAKHHFQESQDYIKQSRQQPRVTGNHLKFK